MIGYMTTPNQLDLSEKQKAMKDIATKAKDLQYKFAQKSPRDQKEVIIQYLLTHKSKLTIQGKKLTREVIEIAMKAATFEKEKEDFFHPGNVGLNRAMILLRGLFQKEQQLKEQVRYTEIVQLNLYRYVFDKLNALDNGKLFASLLKNLCDEFDINKEAFVVQKTNTFFNANQGNSVPDLDTCKMDVIREMFSVIDKLNQNSKENVREITKDDIELSSTISQGIRSSSP